MAKIWVKDRAELQHIRNRLAVVVSLVNDLAIKESQNGTKFQTHKALNILFKELSASENLLCCMAGRMTKSELRGLSPEVQEPQSRKMFLS